MAGTSAWRWGIHAALYNLSTTTWPYRSTTMPGRSSFSPCTTRYAVVGVGPPAESANWARLAAAAAILAWKNVVSMATGLPLWRTLSLITDAGSHMPMAAKLRSASNTTARSPAAPSLFTDVIDWS